MFLTSPSAISVGRDGILRRRPRVPGDLVRAYKRSVTVSLVRRNLSAARCNRGQILPDTSVKGRAARRSTCSSPRCPSDATFGQGRSATAEIIPRPGTGPLFETVEWPRIIVEPLGEKLQLLPLDNRIAVSRCV